MKKLQTQLDSLIKTKKIGLMTHVVIGYPSLAQTEKIILQMEKAGVKLIELQIPFSDPLADGPTIMKANDRALQNGVTVEQCLSFMSDVTKRVAIPLVCMCYYNSAFHYGVKRFYRRLQQSGIEAVIIPDLPPDEEVFEQTAQYAKKYHLAQIAVLSPTSTLKRIALHAKNVTGFVYCTPRVGVTGSDTVIDQSTKEFFKRVKNELKLPIAVGFGISSQQHVRAISNEADIAVVGSAVIKVIETQGVSAVTSFLESLCR